MKACLSHRMSGPAPSSRFRNLRTILLIYALLAFILAPSAYAADVRFAPAAPCSTPYVVTNGNDSGEGSLREGINTACDGTVITFAGDTAIYLVSELVINRSLTIDGTGYAVTVSGDTGNDGSRNVRVFNVSAGAVVTLKHLKIEKGTADSGGGISNAGTLTLTRSLVTNNYGATGAGGGILNTGSLTLEDTNLSNNSAVGGGAIGGSGPMTITRAIIFSNTATGYRGGGISTSGATTIEQSSLSDNTAVDAGGGIFTVGLMNIRRSTLSNNSAPRGGGILKSTAAAVLAVEFSTLTGNHATDANGGGAIYAESGGTTNLLNSTVDGNTAIWFGGGIVISAGALRVANSTITGNPGQWGGSGINGNGEIYLTNVVFGYNGGGDCYGVLSANDHNLFQSTGEYACGVANGVGGSQVGVDPKLAALADNGGPTPTRATLDGSPARNAGSTSCPGTDQRGVPRSDGLCDIGAYERAVPAAINVIDITRVDASAIEIGWEPAAGAFSYEVWWTVGSPYFSLPEGAECANPAPYQCTATTGTSFSDPAGLGDPSHNHTYWVRGLNDAGPSPVSGGVGGFAFTLTQ